MSKRERDKGRLRPFVPLDQEVMMSPAWRAATCGARILYIHLKRGWSFRQRNNGRIHLAQRRAQKEMGIADRDSLSRWFRELQFYGFIVMTDPGGLGVDGKGKAPSWRLTELEAPGGHNGNTWMLPTKDFLKWNGTRFQDNQGAAKRTRNWRRAKTAVPAAPAPKLTWSTPTVTEVTDPDEAAAIRRACDGRTLQ